MESIKDGLTEKMPIADNPVHNRQEPAFIPPSPKPETAKQGDTTFKIK
jgi:hypothetical protein